MALHGGIASLGLQAGESSGHSHAQVDAGIKDIVALDGGVAALSQDGHLPALRERDLATRLDLLFAKNLHGVALNVAEAAKVAQ